MAAETETTQDTQPAEGTPYQDPTPATPAQETTSQTPADGSQPAAPAGGASTEPGPGQGAQTPPAQTQATQAQQWASAREYAQSLGFGTASQFQDDQTFIRQVIAQAQQAQLYQQQLQALAAQQSSYLQQQRQAQQPQQAQQPEKPKWWNPPEYSATWEQLLGKDEQGNVVLKPGAPPDILPKYLAYQNYRKEFAEKLLSDPVSTLQPFITDVASQQAQQLVQGHLQRYQDQQWTDTFISQNSEWLHQRDAMGNVLRNPVTGQPTLSPAGQRFAQYVAHAEQSGMRDIRAQEQYARTRLTNDLLMEQYRQSAGQQAANQQVAGANRRPNQTGTLPQAHQSLTGQPPAQNQGLSLREQIAQAMAQNGITDRDILSAQ